MLKLIIGLVFLLIPFLLINRFRDKKLGFFYILSFLLVFHLFIAVLTQAFGIFNYWAVFVINGLVCLGVFIKADFKSLPNNIKKIRVDWILFFIILVLFIQFYSVHNNYTGKITTTFENYREVNNMKYAFPYFSDEWSAVSLIQYSISSGSLPLVNPLWYNKSFPNLELPFHSFTSEIILILGLDPLRDYSHLMIFSSIFICLLVYFILYFSGVDRLISGISALSVSYITTGANLPWLWVFIPIVLGIICFLLGFLFMQVKDKKMIFFLGFLTLVFYPPLFVLYLVSLVAYFYMETISNEKRLKYLFIFLGISFAAALFIFIFGYVAFDFSFAKTFSFIISRLIYPTFTNSAIPNFSIWKVIPIWILIFAFFGLKNYKERAWLIAPVFIGLIYWFFYSFSLIRFVIEYERVVVVTSIFITILSGFGISYMTEILNKIKIIKKYNVLKIIFIAVLVLFLISSFSYTTRENWTNLKLHSSDGMIFAPASPANAYLQEEDLIIFKNITGKKFLSPAWKGTVIGTATGNYPLETKSATLSNEVASYSEFINLDCESKSKFAIEYNFSYFYSSQFDCKGFRLIANSSEGLYLYKYRTIV